jgi:uncharacterized protein YndB with AHSA1/START domain
MVEKQRREVGKTNDVGYQIGVRRTVNVSQEEAWELLTSPGGIRLWLGSTGPINLTKGSAYEMEDGTSGELRIFKANSHLRITWEPPGWPRSSTIQIRVIPKDKRSVVAFHQERIPGPKEREERRAFFRNVLDELETIIQMKSEMP